jgi:isopenicillin-N epimerase
MDEARSRLAAFVGADDADVAFVTNATTGVNTVLRSLRFEPGDEILLDDHEYNATVNAAQAAADRDGARIVVADVPLPLTAADQVVAALLERVTPRTRLLVVSHVTSPTALVFPIERIVAEFQGRGIDVLIDGAHAPGMLPLDLDALGAAYYTGNHHKWVCGPKGSGFLHVRRDRQAGIRPLVISHGANDPRTDRSRFRLEFDWLGTTDPTPHLAVPVALEFMASLLPGGWPAVMAANRALALRGRELVERALRVRAAAPAEMIGSMAAVLLPPGDPGAPVYSPLDDDPLQGALRERHAIEVPILPWPQAWQAIAAGRTRARVLRISAQLYNRLEEYERLGAAVASLLAAEAGAS